jgi:hypothetical protein
MLRELFHLCLDLFHGHDLLCRCQSQLDHRAKS